MDGKRCHRRSKTKPATDPHRHHCDVRHLRRTCGICVLARIAPPAHLYDTLAKCIAQSSTTFYGASVPALRCAKNQVRYGAQYLHTWKCVASGASSSETQVVLITITQYPTWVFATARDWLACRHRRRSPQRPAARCDIINYFKHSHDPFVQFVTNYPFARHDRIRYRGDIFVRDHLTPLSEHGWGKKLMTSSGSAQ